jgi:hypothetical protein
VKRGEKGQTSSDFKGANLNFEVRLRGKIIILEIYKKYHENQREKLILMVFFSNESLIHAPTLLTLHSAHCARSFSPTASLL